MTSHFTEKRILCAAVIVGGTTAAVIEYWFGCDIVKAYQGRLQAPLFSGFLTLAGFIMSVKTNLLLRLYKDLFDSEEYKERVEKASFLNKEPVRRFRPLINLGSFLVNAVLGCFVVALMQVTVGFVQHPWASSIAIGTATGGIVLVLAAWAAIKANLKSWFSILNETDDAECKQRAAEKAKGDPPL